MARKKKNEEEEISFKVKGLTPPPPGLSAVYDDGKGGYEHFPVIMFAVIEDDVAGDVICGMISTPDGLDPCNLDDDFIGFWMKESQDIAEFFADHGHSPDGKAGDGDEDESEDDDE